MAPAKRLWAAVLCGYLALGATLQELPGYVLARFHAGPAVAALAVGTAFAATACARPFAGRAADRGLARPVVIGGAVLTTLAALLHLLAPNVEVLLLARLMMGAGEGALFSGAFPWVLAGTPANRRGRLAGWFGLSMWSGLSVGPLLAVAMHHLGGSQAVWWTVIALPLVSTTLVATTNGQHNRSPIGAVLRVSPRDLIPAGAGLPGLCLGLAAYGYGSLTALLVLYLTGIGGENLGLAVFAIAFLVTRSAGSPLVDRYGGVRVARIVLVIESAGFVLLAGVPRQPVALLAAAIVGVGLGLIYPSSIALTLHRTGALAPGVSVGAMTSFWDLGILAAGPVGGLIATQFGYRPAFAVAACAALAGLGVTYSLHRQVSPVMRS